MDKNWTSTATIDKTYERAKAEGLGLSKNFIRQKCLDGSLKTTRVGVKYYIYWPNLIKLLENGDGFPPPERAEIFKANKAPAGYGNISRIPEDLQ